MKKIQDRSCAEQRPESFCLWRWEWITMTMLAPSQKRNKTIFLVVRIFIFYICSHWRHTDDKDEDNIAADLFPDFLKSSVQTQFYSWLSAITVRRAEDHDSNNLPAGGHSETGDRFISADLEDEKASFHQSAVDAETARENEPIKCFRWATDERVYIWYIRCRVRLI